MAHMSYLDIPLLNSLGWTTGFSGDSWFKTDRNGQEWQVYHSDHTSKLTFVNPERESGNLLREEYDGIFT